MYFTLVGDDPPARARGHALVGLSASSAPGPGGESEWPGEARFIKEMGAGKPGPQPP